MDQRFRPSLNVVPTDFWTVQTEPDFFPIGSAWSSDLDLRFFLSFFAIFSNEVLWGFPFFKINTFSHFVYLSKGKNKLVITSVFSWNLKFYRLSVLNQLYRIRYNSYGKLFVEEICILAKSVIRHFMPSDWSIFVLWNPTTDRGRGATQNRNLWESSLESRW